MSGWGSQGPSWVCKWMKEAKQTRGPGAQISSCREEGYRRTRSLSRSRSMSGLGIPRDGARAPQSSHRWNRFLNRIDPPLHRGGRELRLFCTGGRARRPHGLELLPRPPACQAGATQLGRAGVGHARGRSAQGPGQSRRLGAGGRPLKRPGRLPPPQLLRPRVPAPRPGARLRPCPLISLRAPVATCASPRPVANQCPERRKAPLPFISLEAREAGRDLRAGGVVRRKGKGAGRAALCIKALSV